MIRLIRIIRLDVYFRKNKFQTCKGCFKKNHFIGNVKFFKGWGITFLYRGYITKDSFRCKVKQFQIYFESKNEKMTQDITA